MKILIVMKNKILLMMTLMVAGLSASAQTAEKKAKITNASEVVYNVNTTNNHKEGVYAIQNLNNNGLWLQGVYKDDQRAGNWNFFNKDFKLFMRYNYDQKKLAFLDEHALDNVIVTILSDEDKVRKDASVPLPLCSVDYYLQLMANNIYAVRDAKYKDMDAEVTARIGTDGKATYTVIYSVNGKKADKQKVTLPDDKFAVEWIPSMYNDKPVESEFTAYLKIQGDEPAVDHMRRTSWNY
ncbi:hypothetical protein [Mucilaginibacter sp. AK015]|uniref:hypothetical protein n=1 Tax=Mucilaginibacter sp. AK015 TaxID=2723072 RepID=UPI0016104D47|nr:hypothetical protein [Mucilaginibacter sp. AK015]MBB5396778.1 hypothetical protein [Mucilaginibacter sp. AK015]